MIGRYVFVLVAATGIAFSTLPAQAEDAGVRIGPVGVGVHDHDRDRDRDHDKTTIIKKDRDGDREKTVIKKEHSDD